MGMLANKAKFYMRQSMLYAQLPAVCGIVDQGGDLTNCPSIEGIPYNQITLKKVGI